MPSPAWPGTAVTGMRILSLAIVLWIGALAGCAIRPDDSRLAGTWIKYGGDPAAGSGAYVQLDYRPDGPSHMVVVTRVEDKRWALVFALDDFTVEAETFSVRATCTLSVPEAEDECSGEEPARLIGRFLGADHLELQFDTGAPLRFVRPATLQQWQRRAAEVERRYLESLQESGTQ